jgi:hypothetical protein
MKMTSHERWRVMKDGDFMKHIDHSIENAIMKKNVENRKLRIACR